MDVFTLNFKMCNSFRVGPKNGLLSNVYAQRSSHGYYEEIIRQEGAGNIILRG